MPLKKVLARYVSSWWLPGLALFVAFPAYAVVAFAPWKPLAILAYPLMILVGIAFLGILAAAVLNFVRRRWVTGIVNVLMLPVCGFVAIVLSIGASMVGTSEDHFADGLTIPSNMGITEPKKELEGAPGGPEDAFQNKLLEALKNAGNDDSSVTADVSSLLNLQRDHPDLLRRWLAASPAWRVFKEDGAVCATRRWLIGSVWRYNLHGYYTRNEIVPWSDPGWGKIDFQVRFTIGLSGKPWWRGNKDTTWLLAGETKQVILANDNQMLQSHCVIKAGALCVEVMEQSGAKERRLTKAALGCINEELRPLVGAATWDAVKALLPPGSARQGEPFVELRNSFQPGLYDSEIWVNPGEPGMIYLKAFEVTKGTALSEDRLKEASNEWVGWSDNPAEKFFSNTTFTIYEGDWGKPYAARFEVWFAPDSGAAERKLMERVFKIQGWQR